MLKTKNIFARRNLDEFFEQGIVQWRTCVAKSRVNCTMAWVHVEQRGISFFFFLLVLYPELLWFKYLRGANAN